uniref:Uncharacterized protein n=1 Tax=Anguilla anguilla TaxID=7936 RepID=A0A0E9RZV4_ANGAN
MFNNRVIMTSVTLPAAYQRKIN